ncbi:MAG: penicillin-binding protein [Bacteroidetes bacterium CG02_land_8_20_14_3_00_31_25]|nr:PASTA domain-containing protein [Bacteroidota bacterium]PIV62861.1 MAG: penicillin-binding protein [Bacteroidetes bacterium CG02_land_8_20_14_3_00_31_25]PIX32652.1 MAG: penicillin-binding protein [Bacteroidetes bacterium CG_4_8_14_3_um_filter_31_14]PIY02095.1 MAG: penicillin-binding protein [Bacteroidetes bacterium CG_4_10_14_3_um_filter_31_20]
MSIITFLKSRKFFIHLGLAIGVTIILLITSFFSINLYTHHGEAISVPDLSGLSFEQSQRIADNKGFIVEISDSVHFHDKEKGTVVSQEPVPNSKVKTGRTIYLVVNGIEAEKVPMPDLTGISVRQATSDAELFGLKIGKLSYVPDISTTVLEQKYKGKSIKTNTLILKGATIDLIVGKGESNENTFVPDVTGLTYNEAEQKLSSLSLNVGVAIYDNSIKTTHDSLNAKIWKQHPKSMSDNSIKLGSYIDIWLTMDNDLIPESATKNNLQNDI